MIVTYCCEPLHALTAQRAIVTGAAGCPSDLSEAASAGWGGSLELDVSADFLQRGTDCIQASLRR